MYNVYSMDMGYSAQVLVDDTRVTNCDLGNHCLATIDAIITC